jgi:hypothetical protein
VGGHPGVQEPLRGLRSARRDACSGERGEKRLVILDVGRWSLRWNADGGMHDGSGEVCLIGWSAAVRTEDASAWNSKWHGLHQNHASPRVQARSPSRSGSAGCRGWSAATVTAFLRPPVVVGVWRRGLASHRRARGSVGDPGTAVAWIGSRRTSGGSGHQGMMGSHLRMLLVVMLFQEEVGVGKEERVKQLLRRHHRDCIPVLGAEAAE